MFICYSGAMIAAIIQARMGSTRLPGKILKELVGKPMLWHVVNRVKHAKKVDQVIIATTILPEDDVVEELAKKEGWDYFRGSAENVLERYYNAAKKFGTDTVVRITSDCPLIDPEIIDGCIEAFQKQKYDYVRNAPNQERIFPTGIDDIEVFPIHVLEKAYREAEEFYEKEHVTPYIWENKKNQFMIGEEPRIKNEHKRDYRLSVDYPEDFKVIEAIYDNLYFLHSIIKTEHVIDFLDNNPDIVKINSLRAQKTL